MLQSVLSSRLRPLSLSLIHNRSFPRNLRQALQGTTVLQNRTFAERPLRRKRPKFSRVEGSTVNFEGNNKIDNGPSIHTTGTPILQASMSLAEHSGGFVPLDNEGKEMDMEEYLKFASLSPWVPCPDPVARKILELTELGPNDVHYELGSGDGRLCFHAIDAPYNAKKSVGIDIDPTLIAQSNTRISKRHPPPSNLEFICADLLDVESPQTKEIWSKLRKECNVLTMYFVDEALQKLKPTLEEYLVDTECRVVTVGYEMKGWSPRWVEVIVGLSVFVYDLREMQKLEEDEDLAKGGDQDRHNQIQAGGASLEREREKEEFAPIVDRGPPLEYRTEDPDWDDDDHWDFDETVPFNQDNDDKSR